MAGISAIGLLIRGFVGPDPSMPLLIAPIGAAAALLFAVPASPMAQPWPVIGGNLVSAIIGVSAAKVGLDPMLAAGLAVGGAISAMAFLRCLHPPGGAVALTAVVGGPGIHQLGYGFVLAPVALGTLLLLFAAWLFHRLSGHSYPHRAVHIAEPPQPLPGDFSRDDLRRALEAYPDLLDVDFEDLEEVMLAAEHRADARRRNLIPG